MKHDKTNISCSNYWIVNENKNSIKKAFKIRKKKNNNFNFALQKYFIGMSSLIISKKLYQNLEHGFDKSFEVIGDYDLVLRILKHNDITYINEPLSYYRWHDLNLSRKKFRLNILELIKWRNKIKKLKNFFSISNLIYINDHLLYLMSIYLKNKDKKINFFLFFNRTNKIKNKILIIIIYLIPKNLLKFLRS